MSAMRDATTDIEKAGIDGVDTRKFGKRPVEFSATGHVFAADIASLTTAINNITAQEHEVGTLTNDAGMSLANTELVSAVPNGHVRGVTSSAGNYLQIMSYTFRQVS